MQSSANVSGGPDARRLEDVPAAIREGADLVIDGGELPGTPSTVVDLREYEAGRWAIVRVGAVSASVIRALANGELVSDRAAAVCDLFTGASPRAAAQFAGTPSDASAVCPPRGALLGGAGASAAQASGGT